MGMEIEPGLIQTEQKSLKGSPQEAANIPVINNAWNDTFEGF